MSDTSRPGATRPRGGPKSRSDRGGRLVALGDIHGCSTALRTFIAAIAPQPENKTVTLGGYIDWAPDSPGVIELSIGLSERRRLVPLLGNYEEMLIDVLGTTTTLWFWLDIAARIRWPLNPMKAAGWSPTITSASSEAALERAWEEYADPLTAPFDARLFAERVADGERLWVGWERDYGQDACRRALIGLTRVRIEEVLVEAGRIKPEEFLMRLREIVPPKPIPKKLTQDEMYEAWQAEMKVA